MQKYNIKIKTIIAVLLVIFVLFGYFYNDYTTTSKPEKKYASEVENTRISNLSLAVKIDLTNLNEQVDELIPKRYDFSGNKNGCIKKLGISVDCKWKGHIKKTGDIIILTSKNNMQFKVPLHIKTRVSAGVIKKTVNTHLDLIIKLNQKINPNWDLHSDLNIDIALKQCYIRLLGIKISVCGVIKKPILKALERINTDGLEELQLREKVKKIWKSAHRVNKISANPDIYLVTEPTTLAFSGFNVIDNMLITNLTLGAKLNIVAGYKPDEPEYTPLPSLATDVKDDFSIFLPVKVSYTALEDALKQLSSKDLQYKGNTIIINDIEIYPSSDNLVIGIDFMTDIVNPFLDSKGKVYFYGKPVIDNKNKTIRIENFKLTSEINNNLVEILGFIASKIFNQPIYNFENDYKYLFDKINENPLTFDKMQLNIQLNEKSIRIQELRLLKDDIDIGVIVEGKVELAL